MYPVCIKLYLACIGLFVHILSYTSEQKSYTHKRFIVEVVHLGGFPQSPADARDPIKKSLMEL